MRRFIIVNCQTKLLEIVAAAHPTRRFSSSLHGWQQQSDEYPNDRDNDEQLDQRKSLPRLLIVHLVYDSGLLASYWCAGVV